MGFTLDGDAPDGVDPKVIQSIIEPVMKKQVAMIDREIEEMMARNGLFPPFDLEDLANKGYAMVNNSYMKPDGTQVQKWRLCKIIDTKTFEFAPPKFDIPGMGQNAETTKPD